MRLRWVTSTVVSGNESAESAKPWFWLVISVRSSRRGWVTRSGNCTNACVSAGHPVALMFFTVLLLPGSVPRLRLRPLDSLIPC